MEFAGVVHEADIVAVLIIVLFANIPKGSAFKAPGGIVGRFFGSFCVFAAVPFVQCGGFDGKKTDSDTGIWKNLCELPNYQITELKY